MLEFDEVKKCKTTEELNDFFTKYLDERNLQGEERKQMYWALFYTWKETFLQDIR